MEDIEGKFGVPEVKYTYFLVLIMAEMSSKGYSCSYVCSRRVFVFIYYPVS